MRVFLSVYPDFTLAIPMEAVASMMLYNQKTEKTIQYDQKNRCTFISLPWMFNMHDQAVPHGIVLRAWNSKENKVVLLTAEIKRDIEIPDGEFYPIPKSLGALNFSAIFSGIKFSGNPVLLLNVEQLLQVIQNERFVTDKKPSPPEPQPSPKGVEPEVRGSPLEQPVPTKTPEPPPQEPVEVCEVIEEPPISPAVTPEPPPPEPVEVCEVIEEPPISPAVTVEPPPQEPVEVTEEPPTSPVVTSESYPPEPPPEPVEVIDEPPSPAVTSEPSSLTLEPQTSPQGEVSPLAEVLEVCELIDEPPKSPAVTSEPSPPTPNEVIEVCEFDDKVLEVCEATKVCETIEVVEETSEVFSLTHEPQTSLQSEGSPLEPQTSPQGEISPLDEILELCEIS